MDKNKSKFHDQNYTNQIIQGSHNNQININKNAGGIQINNTNPHNVIYKANKKKYFPSLFNFLKQSLMKAFLPLIIGIITTLLSQFDVQKDFFLAEINEPINFIIYIFSTWNKLNKYELISNIIIILSVFLFAGLIIESFMKSGFLLFKKPFLWFGYIYKKNNDESISKAKYTGKCPVSTCSGYVVVKKPFPNNEKKNDYAGICTQSKLHTYNFDPITSSGDRIHLTPKKEIKHETHNHYT